MIDLIDVFDSSRETQLQTDAANVTSAVVVTTSRRATSILASLDVSGSLYHVVGGGGGGGRRRTGGMDSFHESKSNCLENCRLRRNNVSRMMEHEWFCCCKFNWRVGAGGEWGWGGA